MTTTNLSDFGAREIRVARDLLTAMLDQGLPKGFWNQKVEIMMNRQSGDVFLINEDFQVAMINHDTEKLESFYSSPYEGLEGFFDELEEQYDDMHPEDQEWFNAIKEHRNA